MKKILILVILMSPFFSFASSQNVKLKLSLEEGNIFLFLINHGPYVIELNGDLTLRRKSSNLTLFISDDHGVEYKLNGDIDSVENNRQISLAQDNFYGKYFKISNLKLYYNLPKGVFKIRAIYSAPGKEYLLESEVIEFEIK